MKTRLYVTFLLALALLLSACSGAAQPTQAPQAPQPAQVQPGSYPGPGANAMPANPANPAYPSASGSQPSQVGWEQVAQMLLEGQIASVTVSGTTVTLALKDGQTYVTEQPAADALQKAIDACGAPCADIQVTQQ